MAVGTSHGSLDLVPFTALPYLTGKGHIKDFPVLANAVERKKAAYS
jgi:hypothetical protein